MLKRCIAVVIASTGLALAVFFCARVRVAEGPTQAPHFLNAPNDDYIAYRHVFAFIHFEADSKEKLNHSVNAVVEFYRHSVSLDDDEANALARIALETETRTLAIEQQAAIIITRFRETIDAELKSGRTPSAGPPELQALQKQRVSTTLRGRDELRKAFGESTFSKFDRFLKDGLNLKIETVTSSPHNN